MADFEKRVLNIVRSCEVLIYAPPGYGKTKFVSRTRHHDTLCDLFDTDRFKTESYMPNHWYGIVTNIGALIPRAQMSIAFLPSEEMFKAGCEFKGLVYKPQWYLDAVEQCRQADYVITTGDSLTFYQRFIEKAIHFYFEGEEPIAVPTFKVGYQAQPAIPIAAALPKETLTVTECPVPDCTVSQVTTTGSDIALEIQSLSDSTACMDISKTDTVPSERNIEASGYLVKRLNIVAVPYEFLLDGTPAVYFGGNLVLYGKVFINVNLLLCRHHRDHIKNRFWNKFTSNDEGAVRVLSDVLLPFRFDSSLSGDPGPSSK